MVNRKGLLSTTSKGSADGGLLPTGSAEDGLLLMKKK